VNYAGNAASAEEVLAEIKAAGGQAIAVQADVTNVADVGRLFQEAAGHLRQGRCRGQQRRHHAAAADRECDLEVFDRVIATNLPVGHFVVNCNRPPGMFQQADASLLFRAPSSPRSFADLRPLYRFQGGR